MKYLGNIGNIVMTHFNFIRKGIYIFKKLLVDFLKIRFLKNFIKILKKISIKFIH